MWHRHFDFDFFHHTDQCSNIWKNDFAKSEKKKNQICEIGDRKMNESKQHGICMVVWWWWWFRSFWWLYDPLNEYSLCCLFFEKRKSFLKKRSRNTKCENNTRHAFSFVIFIQPQSMYGNMECVIVAFISQRRQYEDMLAIWWLNCHFIAIELLYTSGNLHANLHSEYTKVYMLHYFVWNWWNHDDNVDKNNNSQRVFSRLLFCISLIVL